MSGQGHVGLAYRAAAGNDRDDPVVQKCLVQGRNRRPGPGMPAEQRIQTDQQCGPDSLAREIRRQPAGMRPQRRTIEAARRLQQFFVQRRRAGCNRTVLVPADADRQPIDRHALYRSRHDDVGTGANPGQRSLVDHDLYAGVARHPDYLAQLETAAVERDRLRLRAA